MFSLPYLLAFIGLITQRSNGTMEMLRLPSPFSVSSVSLDSDTTYGTHLFFAQLQVDVQTYNHLDDLGKDIHTILRSCGDGRLSRVPMQTFCL